MASPHSQHLWCQLSDKPRMTGRDVEHPERLLSNLALALSESITSVSLNSIMHLKKALIFRRFVQIPQLCPRLFPRMKIIDNSRHSLVMINGLRYIIVDHDLHRSGCSLISNERVIQLFFVTILKEGNLISRAVID
jgi:hypothetical protein